MLYTDSLAAAWLAALRVQNPNVFMKILLGRHSWVMEDTIRRFRSKPHSCLPTHRILLRFFKRLRQWGRLLERDTSSHFQSMKKNPTSKPPQNASIGKHNLKPRQRMEMLRCHEGYQPIFDHLLLQDKKEWARSHLCLSFVHATSSPKWKRGHASRLCFFIKQGLGRGTGKKNKNGRSEWKLETNSLDLQSLKKLREVIPSQYEGDYQRRDREVKKKKKP